MSPEEFLLVSRERVDCCRQELDPELLVVIERCEEAGFSRKEILVALAKIIEQEFALLPDLPRYH